MNRKQSPRPSAGESPDGLPLTAEISVQGFDAMVHGLWPFKYVLMYRRWTGRRLAETGVQALFHWEWVMQVYLWWCRRTKRASHPNEVIELFSMSTRA
jgi:hypothetical protein